MQIKAITNFLHGTDRFEIDSEYTVEDGPGYYFCANGWAQEIKPEVVTLEIQDVQIGVTSPNVGG